VLSTRLAAQRALWDVTYPFIKDGDSFTAVIKTYVPIPNETGRSYFRSDTVELKYNNNEK